MKRIIYFIIMLIYTLCNYACGINILETNSDSMEQPDKYISMGYKHVPLDTEEYYQYSFMTDDEKEACNRMRNAVLSYERTVCIADLSLSDSRIMEIIECFLVDNPQYFWLDGSYGLDEQGNIVFDYCDGIYTDESGFGNASGLKIDEMRKTFDNAVSEIVSSINPADSEYEKELAIHDYITKTTSYDELAAESPYVKGVKDWGYSAYGVLVEKSGVCEGYAKAFQYLCYMVGINANCVYGYSHVWNSVQIEGDWYQVDVTWDDPVDSSGNSGEGHHDNFNLTSDEMYKVHPINTDDFYAFLRVPECVSKKYSYRE